MDAHKIRPAAVGAVEEGQLRAVRVRAPGADEDGLDVRLVGEVGGEGVAERDGRGVDVGGEVEVVAAGGGGDKGRHAGERVGGPGVDGGDGGRERLCWRFSPVERAGAAEVGVEGGEVEDEEDEAVFAAVVGEGEGAEATGC